VGGWYHITTRGNEQKAIFRDDRDRAHWCENVGNMAPQFNIAIHAYVLMDNHYHLLIELREANLSEALQWLNVSYAAWFNRRHERVGRLFQGRFKSVAVEPEGWAWELTRYIHLNPVRTGRLGLDKDQRRADRLGIGEKPLREEVEQRMEKLRSYRWSSYRGYIGTLKPPAWLTE
jgi:REP element-mobilizing transposase RayT